MTMTPSMAVGASLGMVALRLGVTPRALRYYEHRGLIAVSRDRWNRRRYDAAAQRQVEIIARLRRCGLSTEVIAEVLQGYRDGEPLARQVLPHLTHKLAELETQCAAVLEEIASLDATLLPKRQGRGHRALIDPGQGRSNRMV